MLFNSLLFVFIFLPISLLVSRQLRGQRLLVWLTVISFLFYALSGRSWFLLPMLFTLAWDFYIAKAIQRESGKRRKFLLILSLLGNLGLLAYFKYSSLIFQTMQPYIVLPPFFYTVALPAGISFYTFQTMSYIIDVYRGDAKAEENFWLFSSFVAFYPHLVAGPLTRHNQLIDGLRKISVQGISSRWRAGIFLFSIGLLKKVLIADPIAEIVDPWVGTMKTLNGVQAAMALLGFSFQIYFDFSGYSDMAIGLARLFGVQLPQNFNSPYQAENISDFWRRWHITLSAWLRDYLYISLGGNRLGRTRRMVNLMITMILGGLWHGASWTFAAWGFYHGLLLSVHHWLEGVLKFKLPLILRRLSTFCLVSFGWIFFRAGTFANARLWIAKLNFFNHANLAGFEFDQNTKTMCRLLLVAGLVTCIPKPASQWDSFESWSPWKQVLLGVLTGWAILNFSNSSHFLYFQF